MLARNKKNNGSSVSGSSSGTFTIVSCSAVVKGQIDIEEDIRVDGSVDGDIFSKGKVIIGPEGCVRGNIKSKSVEVNGKLFGDITTSDVLILRASSYCEGEITTGSIEIEAGASFFGNCRMGDKEKPEVKDNKKGLHVQARDKSKEIAC